MPPTSSPLDDALRHVARDLPERYPGEYVKFDALLSTVCTWEDGHLLHTYGFEHWPYHRAMHQCNLCNFVAKCPVCLHCRAAIRHREATTLPLHPIGGHAGGVDAYALDPRPNLPASFAATYDDQQDEFQRRNQPEAVQQGLPGSGAAPSVPGSRRRRPKRKLDHLGRAANDDLARPDHHPE